MDEINVKFVDFDRYCWLCEHEKKKEDEHPCDLCLNVPAREGTRKPLYFKNSETVK